MQATKPSSHAEFLAQRQRYGKINARDCKIEALRLDNTPDARKQRRKMNDSIIPKRQVALGEFYRGKKGCAKIKMRGNDDSARINKNLRGKNQ